MANVSGSRSLNFSGQFDVSEILENQEKVIKGFGAVKAAAEGSYNAAGTSNAVRQSQLAMQDALKASRLEFTNLSNELKKLGAQFQQGKIDEQAYRTESAKLRLEQQALTAQTKAARGAQVAAIGSYREAQQRLTALGKTIRETAGGFDGLGKAQRARIEEYRKLNAQLTEFDKRMGNNQRNVGNYGSVLNGIGNTLSNLAAQYLSATAIIAGFNRVIQTNAEISDLFSDVQRTAGLTTEQINVLADSLKKIDTRTSLKGLLDIAVIGGQLGIARDQLLGFVRATDQLAVSLSGELQGGAAGVAKSLGVLANIFGVTAKEGGNVELAFNRIGSAILGLGQSGLATGDFLTDFAERVGGVAAQANLSLPVLLSYGAVLQENGVSAEVAGTAFKKLIGSLATKREKFLAVAQISDSTLTLEKFTNIINTDTQKALSLFFDGLQKGGPKTTQFLDLLKSVGLDASRAGQSISALARNQESLNKHIQDSTDDYDNASKAAEQFRIKNDNLAASLAKLQNTVVNITTDPNSDLAQWFKNMVDRVREGIVTIAAFGDVLKKSRFDTDIDIFTKTGETTFFSKEAVQEEIAKRKNLKIQQNTNEAVKIGNQLARDAVQDVKANLDYKDRLGKEEANLAKIRKQIQFEEGKANDGNAKTLDALNASLIKQKIIVKSLKAEFGKNPVGTGVTLTDNKTDKAESARLKRQATLQREIADLINESTKAQLSADDAEVKSVTDKYDKIRLKIQQFYDDPLNKGKKVNQSGLNDAETKQVQAVLDRQSNIRLKSQYDEEAKLFDQFEQYKEKVGLESARKRFNNEFTTAEDYLQKLEMLQKDVLDKFGDPSGYTEAQKQQLEIVTEAAKVQAEKIRAIEDNRFADAYQSALTYSQKIAAVDLDYNRKRKALGENATAEQLANLTKEKDDRIKAYNEENAYARSGYADLMQKYDELTRGEIRKRLEIIKQGYQQQYKEGKLTAEQLNKLVEGIDQNLKGLNGNNTFKNIVDSIKNYREQVSLFGKDSEGAANAQEEMFSVISEGASETATVINTLADSFKTLGIGGDELQATLGQITGVIGGVGEISKAIADKNPVGIVTGSIKLLTSAIELFNFKDKKLAKQIKGYQQQLADLGRSYKQLENDVSNAVGNNIYSSQQAQIDNLLKQQEALTKARDAERAKKKTDQSKVQEYQDQLDSIPGQIQEINKAISENLIQTNFRDLSNNLADAFADAFKSGEDSAKAFDDVFNTVIANAIKNSLKLSILDPIVKKFTDDLTTYAKANNNSIIGFDFDAYKEQLRQAGELFNAGLKGSEDFFKDTGLTATPAEGIKGKLQRELSEQTASEFLGVTRNVYEINVRQLSVMNSTMTILTNSVNYLSNIETNTANTVIELKNTVSRLDLIVANTKGSQATPRDLGL